MQLIPAIICFYTFMLVHVTRCDINLMVHDIVQPHIKITSILQLGVCDLHDNNKKVIIML